MNCGCLVGIVVILLLIWLAVVRFHALERLGLRQSAAERLLSGPPDREAADDLRVQLESAGIRTLGMELYVLPVTGQAHYLAIAVLDPSDGFRYDLGEDPDLFLRYLKELGAGDTAEGLGIGRVAVDFRDEYGDSVLTVTAATDAIHDYAGGRISRQEFLRQVSAAADWLTVVSEVLQ